MNNLDLYSIGEMLIDFMPGNEEGSYIRNAGGAPANVAIAVSKNGLKAGFCGKMGDDDFGHFLIDKLSTYNVEKICEELTKDAITTMAFVTLREDGERSFTFARKPGADMLLMTQEVKEKDIRRTKIVHAGSCSLSKGTAADATRKALQLGSQNDKMVSFDVNYRNLMWDNDEQEAVKAIMEIMEYVDLLKISEEEVEMVGGEDNLFSLIEQFHLTLVVETLGKQGAMCYFRNEKIFCPAGPEKAVDATGAGDAFWGGFLSSLLIQGIEKSIDIQRCHVEKALRYGNISAGICVRKKGAIDSLPTRAEIEKKME